MRKCAAIILAAGLGTRMKSSKAKVLHEISGLPMICYPVKTAVKLGFSPVVIVVGHQAKEVEAALRDFMPKADLRFVKQTRQLGTGHAVRQAKSQLKDFDGDVAILYGDVPLLSVEAMRIFRKAHERSGSVASVMTLFLDNPTGYGRMLLDENHDVIGIVEQKDASPAQKRIQEVNSGIYVADFKKLIARVMKLKNDNAQGEYYLTDALGALAASEKVSAILLEDPLELTGVNNRSDLALVQAALQDQINEYWMNQGVTMQDPATTYIDAQAVVAEDTVLGPNVHLLGRTVVDSGCRIETGTVIRDGEIADGVHVLPYSVIEQSSVATGCQIGPFARIRPDSKIGEKCKVGNFVEIKKTTTGTNTKISHLSYIGDAELGSDINIGAGTITCNYNGVAKFKTVILDGAFIGSDSQLIAPVTIGKGAYVGSGSSITDDVPDDALAVARGHQFIREGYAKRFQKKAAPQKAKKVKTTTSKKKK